MAQKNLNKRNLIVLAAVVLAIAVGGVFTLIRHLQLADVPEDATAYLVISVAGQMYNPIKLEGEETYSIKRGDMENVVAVTKDSITMHSSSCDNQDCVQQGTVTLKNRAKRVLQNMVICLPNEVILELYTQEEVAGLMLSMLEEAEGNTNE